MSCVALTNGAQPYSLSQSDTRRTSSACTALLMLRSWSAPFWSGVSALLMRSNSSGGAQLPANSGTQLTVLKSAPMVIGRLPAIFVGACTILRSRKVGAAKRGQAVWSPANSTVPLGGKCWTYSRSKASRSGRPSCSASYRLAQRRRNTGANANSANELTAGVTSTASAKSNCAARPLPRQA